MKIVIPGGSGQVGAVLARHFVRRGDEVVILSRNPSQQQVVPGSGVREWDARTQGAWIEEIDGADVVINMAGRSVNCRYHAKNRRIIKASRVESTRVVGEAIQQCAKPHLVWLQASTATIYAHRHDAPNDEISGILGGKEDAVPDTWRFSIDVATSWEAAAEEIALPETRLVLLRSAVTMSPDPDGVFDVLLGLIRKGLGGANGDGRQFVSWIHDQDFVRAIDWILEHPELDGAINLSAPNPLPNAEFMRVLREAWGIGFGLPTPRWMAEIGAFFLRTETELILKSRRVVPGRLLDSGFRFEFPEWPNAARDLCERWRHVARAPAP